MASTERIFDRETLLDLTVNIIPLGIIGFFLVLFLIKDPWGWDGLTNIIMIGLHIVPFVSLAALTYISGKAIAGSERAETDQGAGTGHAHEHEGEQPSSIEAETEELRAEEAAAEETAELEAGTEAEAAEAETKRSEE
jgi:hypothetical protein